MHMDQFSVTLDIDSAAERRSEISSNVTASFRIGLMIGFLIALSVLGIGQQIHQFYPDFFYKESSVFLIYSIWMSIDWKVWIFITFTSVMGGVLLSNRLKKKIIESADE